MALASASESQSLENFYNKDTIVYSYLRHERLKSDEIVNDISDRIFSYSLPDQGIKFNYYDSRFTEEENKMSMITKEVHNLSIEIISCILNNALEC